MEYMWVGVGGFLGANARYVLGNWIVARVGPSFPWHTLVINVTGSIAIGLLLTVLTQRLAMAPAWRLFLVVGFLGGYTTFSSYSMEAVSLATEGKWLPALGYVAASNGLALAGTVIGVGLARAIWPD